MKTYFISIVLITSMCLNLSSSGQDTQKKPNVWAFIIGVSEYKNLPDNLQLEFADKDAQSIASFLSDNLLIKESNIITHYNADASKPIIDKDLYNLLLKKAKPGDIVFLYFACHGDIDSKLDDGFFLMHDVSLDVDYFLSDAVRISTIQYLVQKAAEDSIRVVMISDACRSGKMIGTPGGAKSTLTALIQDWNNVFKLVSCQPNESSFEGTHWGGGHGVFSFYLLTGMMGLADENGDNTIQFGELFDYVKNNVKKDTEYGQTPKASGNESFALMKVNPEAKIMAAQMIEDLEPLKSDKKRGRGLVTPIPKDQKLLADSFRYFIQHNIIANPKSCRAYNCCKVVFTEEKTSALSNPLSGRPIIDNQIVWFVEPDKLLKKIDLNSLELAEFAHPLKTLPPDALFTKKGNLLVISQSSEISVFDVATGKKVSRIKSPHTGSTTFIQFLSEKILITFGKDNLLKLWDVQTGSSVSSITIPAMVAQGITFDKDHSYGYLYGDNKKVFTIDLANYINFSELKTPGKTISDIIYNSDFSRFFAYDPKGLLMLYRTNGNSLIKTYKVNAKPNQLHWFEHNIVFLNKSGKISVLNTINDSIYATTIKPGEKIFINNNSLISISDKKLTSFQIRYEPDLVSAINVLEKIRSLGNFPADDYEILSSELLAASFRIIQPVINGILNGEEVPPGIDTVQYAQELAIYLTSLFDENIITGDLQAINVFLEAYLSILKNETQKYDYYIEQLVKESEKEPNAAYPNLLLSRIYQKSNKPDSALWFARKAAEASPHWTEPINEQGQIYFNSADYKKSIGQYESIIRLRPEISKGYSHLGNIYTHLGNYKKAESLFEKSLSLDSLNPYIYSSYAKLQTKRGRVKDAEELLAKGTKLSYAYADASITSGDFNLARYLSQESDTAILRNAENNYLQAVFFNPYDDNSIFKLAEFYVFLLQRKDNELIANMLINRFDPKGLGRTFTELAIEYIDSLCMRGHTISPQNHKFYLIKAALFMLLDIPDPDKAKGILGEQAQNTPNKAEVHFDAGYYYLNAGDTTSAEASFKRAISADSLYFQAWEGLFDLYLSTGNFTKAKKLFPIVDKLFPTTPVFKYKIAMMSKNPDMQLLKSALKNDNGFIPAVVSSENNNFISSGSKLSKTGNSQFGIDFTREKVICENFIIIQSAEKFGLLDIAGNIVLPVNFTSIIQIDKKKVIAINEHSTIFTEIIWLNLNNGKVELKKTCQSARFISDKHIVLKDPSENSGLIDIQGNTIIAPAAIAIVGFVDQTQLLEVQKSDRFGCMNLKGETVIPFKYDNISPCTCFGITTVCVYENGERIWLSTSGEVLNACAD